MLKKGLRNFQMIEEKNSIEGWKDKVEKMSQKVHKKLNRKDEKKDE